VDLGLLTLIVLAVFGVVGFVAVVLAFAWRRVVPTNMVHIVQSRTKTTSYGTNLPSGNVYYKVPASIPFFGVLVRELPTSNFDIKLDAYDAYDKDRAPFLLDLIGFFVIEDTNKAAAKAESFDRLVAQLKDIMRGAARTVLAKHEVNEIMGDRATFGNAFTHEVDDGLKEWGVRSVKSMELMDIRDAAGSKIIADIMAKKASAIEMDSRKTVAENKKQAEIAEIEADREVELQEQDKLQKVGERTAGQEQAVGIAKEAAQQKIKEAAAETMRKQKAVEEVERVRTAEIDKAAALVIAEEQKQVAIIAADAAKATDIVRAEGEKQQTVLRAEGQLEEARREADGIRAKGEAEAEAKRLLEMARVAPELELADGLAKVAGYTDYLQALAAIAAAKEVGVANAGALEKADIQVFANSNDAAQSLGSIGDLLGTGGGIKVGALLEGLKATDTGRLLLGKLLGETANDRDPVAPAKSA